jgi:hypothetical protein
MAQSVSDREFVDKLRSLEGQRTVVASITVAVGFLLLGLAAFVTSTTFRHIMVSDLLPTASATADIILTIEQLSYWWGVAIGFTTALAWLLAVYFVFSGVQHVRQGRAQRLLIEYFDKAAGQT